jgi:hypothetical protein
MKTSNCRNRFELSMFLAEFGSRTEKKRAPKRPLPVRGRQARSEALLALVEIAVVLDAGHAQPRHTAAID